MLEVLGEDYIRTARSKGLSERRVIYRHALRAALTSVVTQLGIDIGVLLGGAVVTENVFGLPGLGQLAIQSVTQQDLPVIIGIVMLAAAFVVVVQHRRRPALRRARPARPGPLAASCSSPTCLPRPGSRCPRTAAPEPLSREPLSRDPEPRSATACCPYPCILTPPSESPSTPPATRPPS